MRYECESHEDMRGGGRLHDGWVCLDDDGVTLDLRVNFDDFPAIYKFIKEQRDGS